MHKQYIKIFYSLFSEYEGYGFLGNKEMMKYKLQLKLNRHIPLKYINSSLRIFREAGLIHNKVTHCKFASKSKFAIGNLSFGGSKYIWTKIELDEKTISKKLEDLSIMFENFKDETTETVTKIELEDYKSIFKEKLLIFKNVFGDDYINYYPRYFDKEIYKVSGIVIYDLNKYNFLNSLDKMKKYNEHFFISEKQYIDQSNNTSKIIAEKESLLYNELTNVSQKIVDILVKVITELININGSIPIVICNNRYSVIFGEILINHADIKTIKDKNWIVLTNDNCSIELNPWNLSLHKDSICFYNGGSNEELRILLNSKPSDLDYLEFLIQKYHNMRSELYHY